MRDLSEPCPRSISSHWRAVIKDRAQAVVTNDYEVGMNLSGQLEAQDLFAVKGLLSGEKVTWIHLTNLWLIIYSQNLKISSGATLGRFRLSQIHLKVSHLGHYIEWESNRTLQKEDMFFVDEHKLERLKPCLAGDFYQTISPRNIFKQVRIIYSLNHEYKLNK